jgi:cellobiose epimerase
MAQARSQLQVHLMEGIIPFWTKRAVDEVYGGYFTCFDAAGDLILGQTEPGHADTQHRITDKHIVTQTRLIWGFSLFYKITGDVIHREAARQGVDFFIDYFWDVVHGGWNWLVARDGTLIDDGKVVYGQSFAIYALATYYLATGDERGLDYAERTFDLLQRYCVDTARGGYYENLEADWQLAPGGVAAGDRKSLDIHMHLLEAFTVLAQASSVHTIGGKEIHRRRLQEVIDVILTHMIDSESGCGGNQYDLAFNPIPAIAIRRTFNADREGAAVATPTDTTSYGHNVELAWLLVRADEVLGADAGTSELWGTRYIDVVRRLVDHALKYGLDHERGGIYRDGPHDGPPFVRDKEFWQNAEVLVGFLEAFKLTGDARYAEAFLLTWDFVREHMINHELGEWMTLVSETGEPLVAAIGSPWKACYHSGRAVYEAVKRLDMVLAN